MRRFLSLSVLFVVACSSSDPATPATTTPDAATTSNDAGPANDVSDAAADAAVDPLSTDRTLFFGASRCAGLMFCDDFESGAIDAAKWQTPTATKPVVDDTQHARGGKALHVVLPGSGASYLVTKAPFPAPMNRYWGRAFFRFGKLPGAPMTYAHWSFAAASGTGIKGEIRLSGQLQNGKNLFGVGTDNRTEDAGTGDWTTSDNDPAKAPRPVPTDEWMCIEWLHAGDVNETHFYWDAVEHPSLATTLTTHGGTKTTPYVLPQFTQVWVGWAEYQDPAVPFEMWVDEVAFDSTRIGCVR